MSFVELKEKVIELSREDRLRLAALLSDLEEGQEQEFRDEVFRRMKAMDCGEKVSMGEFESRHEELGIKRP